MSTTRDVILRIKTELQGARGGPATGLGALSREATRAESDISKARRGVKGMTDDLARMERQAKRTGDALKFGASGRISGIAGVGGQAGGQGGGMFGGLGGGMGKLAGFGPLAAFTMMLGQTTKEYVTARLGHAAAGGRGTLMKGSFGPIEDIYHKYIAGTEYRERNEDEFEQKTLMKARRRESIWNAEQEFQREQDALQLQRLPVGTTSRERLMALQRQGNWNIAGVQAQGAGLLQEQAVLQRSKDDVQKQFDKFFPNYKAGDQIGLTGHKMTKFTELEGQRKELLTKEKELGIFIVENLKQQADMHSRIKENLQQQLGTVKEMTMARKSSLTSFGMLDPFQQRAAVGVATALKNQQPLTPEQRALGMQVPEIAEFMQRDAASRAVNNPLYEQMLQLVGRPGDAEQFAKSRDATSKIQLKPGQMTIDVFLQVDENMLADAIAKQLEPTMKEIRDIQVKLADKVRDAEQLNLRRHSDRNSSFGRGVD